jgi:hypothetical protein
MSEHTHDTSHYPEVVPDHSVKVAHLVFGLFFLGVAGIWALVQGGVITADRLTVLGPAVLIAAGVIGLAATLANSRNRQRRTARNDLDAPHVDTDTTTDTTGTTTQTTDTQEIR